MKSGGKILVDCLVNQGASTAYGVPGESYLDVLDALYDVPDKIRLIITRHEGGAAFMAEAYGKLTGKPGICFVTRGPGATNASIGVHTAMQNSSPMILFVGQIGRDMREREAFQEIDYRAFYGKVAKWVTEIDNADRIPEIVARAFSTATSGRPGPVVIALPEDMLTSRSSAVAGPKVITSEAAPNAGSIDAALAHLRCAKRPLLLVGGGGWTPQGRADLQRFVDTAGVPVAVAFRCQDLIDHRKPSYVGDAGVGMAPYMKDMIRDADVILALNIRFGEMTTDGWTLLNVPNPSQTLIHSHASDRELGKTYQAEVPIHAGPNETVKALAASVTGAALSDWAKEGRKSYDALQSNAKHHGDLDMAMVCSHLRAHLDADTIITNGAGNFATWPSKFLTYNGKSRLLAPQSGAMGAGFPAAIAAKSVDQNRQVVCFAGDGDFQMTMSEMGTAMQENLQPIILLLNNGMYGTIRAHQERTYPERVSGTKIENPDFVAIARAYGFHSERVESTEAFAAAFDRAAASKTGALLELMIDAQDLSPTQSLDDMREQGKAKKVENTK